MSSVSNILSKDLRKSIDELGLDEFTSCNDLIRILKEIECEMQVMHAKLNEMNGKY